VNREEQLEWEARWSRPAAAAAAVGVALPILATVYQNSQIAAPARGRDTAVVGMRVVDQNHDVLLVGGALQAIAVALVGAVLAYLYRVVKYRRPELPSAALILGVLGPILYGLAAFVLLNLDRFDNADAFFASGPQTEARADDLIVERSGFTLGLGIAGTLAMAFGLISISLAAMRAGITSRFLGIIGVILGALFVIGQVVPVFAPLVIQFFWLGAMIVLFLDRWPGGRGPAWAAGEAIPWPSAMDQAKAREAAQGGEVPESEAPSAPKPSRKKRKR
jgi:Domain of unknown function (DUF4386)